LADPVCACLAMAIMDPTWSIRFTSSPSDDRTTVIEGKGKQYWLEQLKWVVSNGFCCPQKKEVQKLLVALYLLFCGDSLRRQRDTDYMTFSVPLHEWIRLLLAGGKSQADTDQKMSEDSKTGPSVSFIQVCHNSVDTYGFDWSYLCHEPFLKRLYEAGTAFYTFPDCPLIHMVAPIRFVDPHDKIQKDTRELGLKHDTYSPLLISIQSHDACKPKDAIEMCEAALRQLEKVDCQRALFLLILLGPMAETDYGDYRLKEDDATALFEEKGCLARILCMPASETFGVSKTLALLTQPLQSSEVYASHSFVRASDESIACADNSINVDAFASGAAQTESEES